MILDKVGSDLSDGRHFCAPSWLINMATAPDPNAVTALAATLWAKSNNWRKPFTKLSLPQVRLGQ